MTEMQRKWYKMLLEKDIDAVNGTFTAIPVVFLGEGDGRGRGRERMKAQKGRS